MMIKTRRSVVAQCQQTYDLDAAGNEFSCALQHLVTVTPFIQISDKDQDGLCGLCNNLLAIGQGAINICATPELGAEKQIDGILQVVGEISHGGIEDDHPCTYCPNRGQDSSEDARIDNRRCHGATLIDAQDDIAQRRAFMSM